MNVCLVQLKQLGWDIWMKASIERHSQDDEYY